MEAETNVTVVEAATGRKGTGDKVDLPGRQEDDLRLRQPGHDQRPERRSSAASRSCSTWHATRSSGQRRGTDEGDVQARRVTSSSEFAESAEFAAVQKRCECRGPPSNRCELRATVLSDTLRARWLKPDRRTPSRSARGEHLVKVYKARKVVRDVSVEIRQGEIVGLLGPNGAGKTTTFYMIVGLVRPDGGTRLARRRRHHRAADVPARAARHQLSAAGGVGLPEADRRRESALGLRDDESAAGRAAAAHRRSCSKSSGSRTSRGTGLTRCRGERGGGWRSRRSLAINPAFILLDEPFAGIDPIAVFEIQRIVSQLRARGIGILITDHNVRETLKITDRAYIIKEGEIFRQGVPESLSADAEVRRIYLGETFNLN